MTKYGNYDLIQGFKFHYIMVNIGSGDSFSCSIQSHYLNRCIESRLVPMDTLGTRLSVNIVYCTRISGVLLGTSSIGIDIQYFHCIKSLSKWRLLNGRHISLASIWLFENVPGSVDTLGAKPSVNNVYKTMFLLKNITEYLHLAYMGINYD